MEQVKENRYLILGVIVGAVVVYGASSFTIERKLSQLQLSLDTAIDVASREATDLAREVGRGGQMHRATALIADCSATERDTFETHLARLDQGLNRSTLEELDKLFSRCAPTQAVRRTIINMDLSRRVDNLAGLVNQRKQIGNYTKYDADLERLISLVALEEEITEVAFDLVFLQRDIITALLRGESPDSEKATELKERGVVLRTELSAKAATAARIRSELIES